MIELNREMIGLDTLKDCAMKMRLIKGVWYSAFKYKGRYIGRCLNASEKQVRSAERNLVKLIDELERGGNSKSARFLDLVQGSRVPFYRVSCLLIVLAFPPALGISRRILDVYACLM